MYHEALKAMKGKFPVVLCFVATRKGFLCGFDLHDVDIRKATPFTSVDEAMEAAKDTPGYFAILTSTPGHHESGLFYVATKYGFLDSATSGHCVKDVRSAFLFTTWEAAHSAGATAASRLMSNKGGVLHWAILSA